MIFHVERGCVDVEVAEFIACAGINAQFLGIEGHRAHAGIVGNAMYLPVFSVEHNQSVVVGKRHQVVTDLANLPVLGSSVVFDG